MLNAWWIHADRVLASGNPTDSDLAGLSGKGFTVIISLLDERRERPKYDVAKALVQGWTRHKVEIPESGTPSLDQLHEFVRLIRTAPSEAKILVHCGTGAGRAATMGAAYWIGQSLSAEEAIERIRKAVKRDEWITDDRRRVLNKFANASQQDGPRRC